MAEVYWIRLPEHTDVFSQGYVGVTTKTSAARFLEHVSASRWKQKKKLKISNAICKHGEENLVGCKSDAPFGAPLRGVLFTCQIGDNPSAKRRRILHNEPLLPGVYIYTFPHKWQINSAYLSKYFAIKSSTVRQYSVGATEDESAWPAPSTVSSSFSQAAAAYNSPSILYGTSSSDEP